MSANTLIDVICEFDDQGKAIPPMEVLRDMKNGDLENDAGEPYSLCIVRKANSPLLHQWCLYNPLSMEPGRKYEPLIPTGYKSSNGPINTFKKSEDQRLDDLERDVKILKLALQELKRRGPITPKFNTKPTPALELKKAITK